MKLIKLLKGLAVTAATFGILLPFPTITDAAENAAASSRQADAVRDLALGAGGVLRGQVVNKDGLPDQGALVSLIRDGGTVATAKTDENGAFAVAGLPGGVYAIHSGKASGVVRAWSPQTAPPSASKGVLLVPSDLTVRGQELLGDHDGLSLGQIGVGGLLVLGLVGTIIAVSLGDDAS
jgi:hypothetical protein